MRDKGTEMIKIGDRVSMLTLKAPAGRTKDYKRLWLCACDCGRQKIIRERSLLNGDTRSCGCLKIGRITHGKSNTLIYFTWHNMLTRCFDKNTKDYDNYGGRGITVCERWRTFENFYKDMGNAPSEMTLDRQDNDGNYEPNNCRWVSRKVQNRNRRNRLTVTYLDETKPLQDWAVDLGIKYSTLRARLLVYKWPIEKALKEFSL